MGSTSPQVVNTVTRSLKRKREKKNNKRSLCDNERLKKTEITSFRIKGVLYHDTFATPMQCKLVEIEFTC